MNICYNVRLTYSSLCTICDKASRTEESARSGTKVSTRKISYSRSSNIEHLEKMLSTWIESEVMPRACKCVFGSSQGLFCVKLTHLVQVQVGSAGSQSDIIFSALK